MKNILVFCSANDLEEKYTKSAEEFARLIPKNGYGLVWGGSDKGIMKIVASTVQDNHGKIIGVTMELLKNQVREGADEMIVAKDLGERQKIMVDKSDVIVAMPGGIGTLNEITAVIEMKKHKVHDKPIILLNTGGFFDGLKLQMEKMHSEGFLPIAIDEALIFVDEPQEVFDYLLLKK